MGLIRKALSASTLGAVDWKSDKERMAASARKTKQATKKGNKLLAEQNAILRQQAAAQQATAVRQASPVASPTAPPAGWYDDPDSASGKRWWDGSAWTEHRNS